MFLCLAEKRYFPKINIQQLFSKVETAASVVASDQK